jgi:hypothetical protein
VLNRFKGSNAAGGLDVNRIEEALASSSSLREPMPMVAMQQLFQLALSLADRTLCERKSKLPLSALPTGARMPERLKFLNNNVESVLAALLIRRLAVPGFILVWGNVPRSTLSRSLGRADRWIVYECAHRPDHRRQGEHRNCAAQLSKGAEPMKRNGRVRFANGLVRSRISNAASAGLGDHRL